VLTRCKKLYAILILEHTPHGLEDFAPARIHLFTAICFDDAHGLARNTR